MPPAQSGTLGRNPKLVSGTGRSLNGACQCNFRGGGSGASGACFKAARQYAVKTRNGLPDWPQSEHKEIIRFEVAGNTVHFTIRNEISRGGDTNYQRDDYNLNLSGDGGELIGSKRSVFTWDSQDVRETVTPITLFPTDWNTRSQPQVKL